MTESTNPPPPGQPDDPTLLAAVGRLWQQVDPPPGDLADGVLARIAAEDLEFELLTLVETQGELAGVRHAEPEGDDAGAWLLEYQGPDERVYVRLTRIEDRTRVDGWVVPTRPMAVQLSAAEADRGEEPLESEVDEFGRFEFPSAPAGLSRLTFLDVPRGASRPRVTPPFWI
jgi:hypothetical protein